MVDFKKLKIENERRNRHKEKKPNVIAADISGSASALVLHITDEHGNEGYLEPELLYDCQNLPIIETVRLLQKALLVQLERAHRFSNERVVFVIEAFSESMDRCDKTNFSGFIVYYVEELIRFARDVLGLEVIRAYTWGWRRPFELPTQVKAREAQNMEKAKNYGHDYLKIFSGLKFNELTTNAKRSGSHRFDKILELIDKNEHKKKLDDVMEAVLMTEAFFLQGAVAMTQNYFNAVYIEDLEKNIFGGTT